MAYSLTSLQEDCYEGTNVLKNKFGLKKEEQLIIAERNITSFLIAKAELEIPFTNVDFEFYKNLHKYVFGDIYEWAGQTRKVDISKKNTKFCNADEIEQKGRNIFQRLIKNNFFRDMERKEFVSELTELYCDLNMLHPFREGNGRIQRLFLSMLLRNNNKSIDFTKIDKDEIMIATIKSVTGDIFMLRDLLDKHIKEMTKI